MMHCNEGLECKKAKNIDYFALSTEGVHARVKMELETEITIHKLTLYAKMNKIGHIIKILAKTDTRNCPVLCTPTEK